MRGPAYTLAQQLGGVAAPAFLFLSGTSALLANQDKPRTTAIVRRGLYVLGVAFLFRFFEWAVGGDGADLWGIFRVDVLNAIGVSFLVLATLLALGCKARSLAALALAVLLLTPAAKSAALPDHPLAYYIAHHDMAPFALFPWLAYVLAGAALGERLLGQGSRAQQALDRWAFVAFLLVVPLRVGHELSNLPAHDFAPAFSALRILQTAGLLWLIPRLLAVVPSPKRVEQILVVLSRHSLLVYCIHVELCYGLLLWRFRGHQGWPATLLLSLIILIVSTYIGAKAKLLLSNAVQWLRQKDLLPTRAA